jgi:hypothetical protein
MKSFIMIISWVMITLALSRFAARPADSGLLAAGRTWSSQGNWTVAEQSDPRLDYTGTWSTVSSARASGGTYISATVKTNQRRQAAYVRYFGRSLRVEYPTDPVGGTAAIFVDGESRGTISFRSDAPGWGVRTSILTGVKGDHIVEIRAVSGSIYLDRLYVDGRLFEDGFQFAGVMSGEVTGATTRFQTGVRN